MSVELVDLFRTVVTVAAAISAVVNVSLVPTLIRLRDHLHSPGPVIAYALAAFGTNCVSIYFRLRDGFTNAGWVDGDFTALVPTVGFLTAGLLTWRVLGRRSIEVEHDMLKGMGN